MTTARARNSFKNQRVTRQPGEWGFSERAPCVSKSGDALIQYSLRAQLYNTWLCAGTGENGRESLLLLLPPGMKTLQIKKKKKFLERCNLGSGSVCILRTRDTQVYQSRLCAVCRKKGILPKSMQGSVLRICWPQTQLQTWYLSCFKIW